MSKKTRAVGKQRNRHSAEFKKQAMERVDKDGVVIAARDLGLDRSQLYAWRTRARQQGQNDEKHRLAQAEAARLKREVARLEEKPT